MTSAAPPPGVSIADAHLEEVADGIYAYIQPDGSRCWTLQLHSPRSRACDVGSSPNQPTGPPGLTRPHQRRRADPRNRLPSIRSISQEHDVATTHRRDTLKAEIIAAVKNEVIKELASDAIADDGFSDTLEVSLVNGRVLQARLSEGESGEPVPSELATEIARWEARTLNFLMAFYSEASSEAWLKARGSTVNVFNATALIVFNKMAKQLEVIEMTLRHEPESGPIQDHELCRRLPSC